MGLTADEQKVLDELTAKAAEPDADESYEIEVYDTAAGKGARIPFSQGKGWLFETFGIGQAPAKPDDQDGQDDKGGKGGQGKGGQPGQGTGYFGRRTG